MAADLRRLEPHQATSNNQRGYIQMAFWDFLKPLKLKAPEITYFNHLAGELKSLETIQAPKPPAAEPPTAEPPAGEPPAAVPPVTPPSDAAATARRMIAEIGKKVEALKAKRDDETIDWNDLYLLEMLLAEVRPVGALRSKVLSLRRDYRSIAGQVEYDEYLASKPKNLLDPPDPRNPPDKNADYERLLRDDLKDVLGRLFKRYAILPIREARLKRLTIYASLFCGVFLAILIIIILSMNSQKAESDGGRSAAERSNAAHEAAGGANVNGGPIVDGTKGTEGEGNRLPSIALFVVLVSGAMGGFVSALQRIQSSPTEGDSVYNLALLYHGSYAVFVAPLTGAIFGILLYMMFAGEILEGRFFPNIYTPDATTAANTKTKTDATTDTDATNDTNDTNDIDATTDTNVTTVTTDTTGTDVTTDTTDTDGNTDTSTEPNGETPTASLGVRDFLYQSGPAGGADYALLIIWSFIAGFAERFVPDSLNRLISNK